MSGCGRGISLEGVRQVEARVVCRGVGGPGGSKELLEATRLRCQKGGALHDGIFCVECDRFVNFKPSRNRATVTIRCQWRLDDRVSDLMTRGSALVFVDPDMSVAASDDVARANGVHHLLVARGGDLLGVVCRCDLAEPALDGDTVGARMSRDIWSVPSWANLAEVADVMTARRIGCLPVIEDGVLVGIVTRGDLRAAGMDDELLGEPRCQDSFEAAIV